MELKILKQEETPENVIEHSKAVCKKAMKIADNFKDADKDLIKKGALLHDIGRSKTHGITHAVEGAKIVREYGYPEEVQNIVERHIGAGLSEDEAINGSKYEYCQGFGFKYLARPSVSLKANATNIKISMQVKNLTSVEMPLQYMCHINHR